MRLKYFVFAITLVICSGCSALFGPSESVHTVQNGETLTSIARRYGISPVELQRVNGIKDPRRLQIGKKLTVAGGIREEQQQGDTPKDTYKGSADGVRVVSIAPVAGYIGSLAMPVSHGRFSSRFGWRWKRFHEGVDLAVAPGTPIRAAHDGVVVLARNNWGRYGKVIAIKGDGLMTVYAHNSKNLVRKGQRVTARDIIGEVGATGNVTGPHLHFETRIRDEDGKFAAINPRLFFR